MKITATRKDAMELFMRGAQALHKASQNGIAIDVEYFELQKQKIARRSDRILAKIEKSKEGKAWKKRWGPKTNYTSTQQLGVLLEDLELADELPKTKTGLVCTAEDALASVDLQIVRDVLSVRKLEKVSGTYINNFLKEEVDGLIHPSYGLIIPRSYRSQSNDPNFQNNPIRDDMMSKIIRRGVIVREPNRQIGELDYGQQEVRVAGCLTGDPNLIEYVTSPNKDMHTDMAMRVFILTERQVTKKIRYCAKNRFVFPEFYGSWWKEVAINLWKSIGEFDLETADGIPLKEHLADYGITELGKVIKTKNGLKPEKGTFMEHIAQVEDWYWNELYHEYTKWKERHWKRYLRKGYFDTLTGFRVSGPMSKNQTINIPVQGPAFHCLLWSFIELTDYLEKQKMESLLIGQIHDSALGDFVSDELPDFLTTAKRIMTEDIRKAWEWLIVPLVIEAEISPPGGSWYDKQEEPI